MKTLLFEVSYILLLASLVWEGLMLRNILRETVWFHQLLASHRRPLRLKAGTVAPRFTARMVGRPVPVDSADLIGWPTVLLFISSDEASSSDYIQLSAAIHAFWHKVDGQLYFVCKGAESTCTQLVRKHLIDGLSHSADHIVLDPHGHIASAFLISTTPQAVLLDGKWQVKQYGRPAFSNHMQPGNDGVVRSILTASH